MHIPLGPRPWLHQLRSRLPGLVRRLHSYYGGVRLLMIVHHRLRLLAFPTRTSAARTWRWPTMRSPGSRAKSVRTCQCLRPRRAVWALALSRPSVLPSVSEQRAHAADRGLHHQFAGRVEHKGVRRHKSLQYAEEAAGETGVSRRDRQRRSVCSREHCAEGCARSGFSRIALRILPDRRAHDAQRDYDAR